MKHRWEHTREHVQRCTRCGLTKTSRQQGDIWGSIWVVDWRWEAPATGEVFTREGGATPTCPPSADGVVPREGRAE